VSDDTELVFLGSRDIQALALERPWAALSDESFLERCRWLSAEARRRYEEAEERFDDALEELSRAWADARRPTLDEHPRSASAG
jgi:hypothetical protein